MLRKKYRSGGAVKGYADGGKVVSDKPGFFAEVADSVKLRVNELTGNKLRKPKVEGMAKQDRMYTNPKRQKQLDEET